MKTCILSTNLSWCYSNTNHQDLSSVVNDIHNMHDLFTIFLRDWAIDTWILKFYPRLRWHFLAFWNQFRKWIVIFLIVIVEPYDSMKKFERMHFLCEKNVKSKNLNGLTLGGICEIYLYISFYILFISNPLLTHAL